MYYYVISLLLILICAGLGASASAKVRSTYKRYENVAVQSHMTGYDTAKRLLKNNGVHGISVGKVSGFLTDHYHPTKNIVNLSESVYGSDSVAAVAVSAHEIGHVLQRKTGYFPYKLRSVLVPITNFGSRLALPLVLLGLVLDVFVYGTQNSDAGYYLAIAGVVLYGLSTVFALVTLPVELDASRRAKEMLIEEGILTEEEAPHASKMLKAAAQTYVASLLASALYFLRFALWVFLLFGRGRRRR